MQPEYKVPGYLFIFYLIFLAPLVWLTIRLFSGHMGAVEFFAPILLVISLIVAFRKKFITLWWMVLSIVPVGLSAFFLLAINRSVLDLFFYIAAVFLALLASLLNNNILRAMDAHDQIIPITTLHMSIFAISMNLLLFFQQSLAVVTQRLAERGIAQLVVFDINILLAFATGFVGFSIPAIVAQHDRRETFSLLIPIILFSIGYVALISFGL